jgi:hypothetical protein
MDVDEFWSLIDRSRDGREDDIDDQESALEDLLREHGREDLIAFTRLYEELMARSYRWDLWGVGYLINGGMSDDSFDYFREWLISRGRAVFERALEDPDSLAGVVGEVDQDEGLEAEAFGSAARTVYEEQYGEEMPMDDTIAFPTEPAGEEWDEEGDQLRQWFPRVWARYGWES